MALNPHPRLLESFDELVKTKFYTDYSSSKCLGLCQPSLFPQKNIQAKAEKRFFGIGTPPPSPEKCQTFF